MIAVSDTSPLNYLILIEQVEILPRLYDRVQIPLKVREELGDPKTPEVVNHWISSPPGWLSTIAVQPESLIPRSDHIEEGEWQAISLAVHGGADLILMDDRRGRQEARLYGIRTLGTLGILLDAAAQGLTDLPLAVERLRETTFHVHPALLAQILASYRTPRG